MTIRVRVSVASNLSAAHAGVAVGVPTIPSAPSQMVAVYDVVEIAGISYGMISKRLAYDLNRNHTM